VNQYPYKSRNRKVLAKLRKERDYTVWYRPGVSNLQGLISGVTKPLVEIGGPTPDGFYFLDNLELPSKIIVTNISSNPMPYSSEAEEIAHHISKIMDARKMPYEDGSIGCFLMSGMSMTNDWYMELSEADREKQAEQIESESDIAMLELAQAALGTIKSSEAKWAQRLQIFSEVERTLTDGGLFFTDGSLAEIIVLKNLGFRLLVYTQEHIRPEQNWDGLFYEFVVQK
jgi:hypothetical protein